MEYLLNNSVCFYNHPHFVLLYTQRQRLMLKHNTLATKADAGVQNRQLLVHAFNSPLFSAPFWRYKWQHGFKSLLLPWSWARLKRSKWVQSCSKVKRWNLMCAGRSEQRETHNAECATPEARFHRGTSFSSQCIWWWNLEEHGISLVTKRRNPILKSKHQ